MQQRLAIPKIVSVKLIDRLYTFAMWISVQPGNWCDCMTKILNFIINVFICVFLVMFAWRSINYRLYVSPFVGWIATLLALLHLLVLLDIILRQRVISM